MAVCEPLCMGVIAGVRATPGKGGTGCARER
jgi:hypothetical protein